MMSDELKEQIGRQMSQISDPFVPREDDWVGGIESSDDELDAADKHFMQTIARKTLTYTISKAQVDSAQ